jgi:hypothetical protein
VTISLERRLMELEDEPSGTDRLDVERLLLAAGYTREYDAAAETYVFTCARWRSTWTFDARMRTVPIPYLLKICRVVRGHIQRERA